jgi:hypothetical protein
MAPWTNELPQNTTLQHDCKQTVEGILGTNLYVVEERNEPRETFFYREGPALGRTLEQFRLALVRISISTS